MPNHTKAATLCCGLHGLPLAVPLRCTFKSGQTILALTQQVKGAVGAAGQQLQQEVNICFSLTTKYRNIAGKF
jgi:hypothetical protein